MSFGRSAIEEEKFYKKLYLIGAGRKELKQILFLQMNALYFAGVFLGILVGMFFSLNVLPKILSSFLSFEIKTMVNYRLIFIPAAVSYVAVLFSRMKLLKLTNNLTTLNGKRVMKPYKRGWESRLKWPFSIMLIRRLRKSKKYVIMTVITLCFGVLVGEAVLTYVNGFDIKKYIKSKQYYDFTIHNKNFSKSYDDVDRVFDFSCLDGLHEEDGITQSGGGAVCSMNLKLPDDIWENYMQCGGPWNNEKGNMYTNVYGLDDALLQNMKVLDGKINEREFATGNYVIINSLGLEETGKSCWKVGDLIEISDINGKSRFYEVMAIAELPYELSYQSKWEGSSDIFMSMSAWQNLTGKHVFYIYTYNVSSNFLDKFEGVCKQKINAQENLTYESTATILEEKASYFKELKTMAVCIVVFIIISTITNFFNVIFSEMIGLKREVAVMQSMGTSLYKIRMTFLLESIVFLFTGTILGALLSPTLCKIFINTIINESYVIYSKSAGITFIYLLLGFMAVVITMFFFKKSVITERTISERIRLSYEG